MIRTAGKADIPQIAEIFKQLHKRCGFDSFFARAKKESKKPRTLRGAFLATVGQSVLRFAKYLTPVARLLASTL